MADRPTPSLDEVTAALTLSHERRVGAGEPLSDDEVSGPSYHDWSIAQVLSHLGSGAEIFRMYVEAGAAGTPAPTIDDFHPVWDRWNAMTPVEQHDGFLRSDIALLDAFG